MWSDNFWSANMWAANMWTDGGAPPAGPDPETSGNVGIALGFRLAFSIALILIGA